MKIIINGESVNIPKSEGEVYSTEETRIGTWIDGKPLYQCTFIGRTPNQAGDGTIANLSDFNINTCVDIFGFVKLTKVSSQISIHHYYQASDRSGDGFVFAYVGNNNLVVSCKHPNYLDCPIHITLKYTKNSESLNTNTLTSRVSFGIDTLDVPETDAPSAFVAEVP